MDTSEEKNLSDEGMYVLLNYFDKTAWNRKKDILFALFSTIFYVGISKMSYIFSNHILA